MILGVGLDICDASRFADKKLDGKFIARFFHTKELEMIKTRKAGITDSLAARFAAKEAFGKAMGTGIGSYSLKEIYTISNDNGKPELILEGSAREAFLGLGGKRIFLSLSHDKGIAAAVVILED